MRYSAEDFASLPVGVTATYPFGIDVFKTAATLRRMADDLERRGGTLIDRVTVVQKAVVNDFAATTVILRLHVPKEEP